MFEFPWEERDISYKKVAEIFVNILTKKGYRISVEESRLPTFPWL